jgi:hypothetical protein
MFKGEPMTREWAAERQKWEPLFEVAQIKGQSEAHPRLSPNDEFIRGYELWDKGNLVLVPKKPGMLEHEYARDALKNGLSVEQDLGVNPFKFGLIGGTDTHTGLAAVEEDNYYGKTTGLEPNPERWDETFQKRGDLIIKGWETSGVELRRGLGDGELAHCDLGRHEAARDLRHERPAHDGAFLRRLRFPAAGRQHAQPRDSRLHQRCADGR